MELLRASAYGTVPFTAAESAEFDSLVEELSGLNPTPEAACSPLISGEWQLLWTTEKELLFAIEKGLFGLKCIGSTQTIDMAGGTLENRVLFEEDSFLEVGSTFSPDATNPKRFNFKFTACTLKWRALELPLPPVGEGWGEVVYLDEDMRIQRDIRGDMLIAAR